MNKKLKQSFDKLNPTSDEKNRIYNEIIQKSEQYSNRRTKMEKNSMVRRVCIAGMAAALLLTTGGGVYAAVKWMNADQTAQMLGDEKLAAAFGKQENDTVVEEAGDYRVVYLGEVSGENISDEIFTSDDEVKNDRTYAAVAIERLDGTDMTYDDEIMVSPLIQGLKPWEFNIATMNGGASYKIVDGIEYRIIETDNIELFADRELYLAVSDNSFNFMDGYTYDDNTGEIGRNDAYTGLNLLFDMQCDASKADPEAAEAYLEGIKEDMSSEDTQSEADDDTEADTGTEADTWTTGEGIQAFNIDYIKQYGTPLDVINTEVDADGYLSYHIEYKNFASKNKILATEVCADNNPGTWDDIGWMQVDDQECILAIIEKNGNGTVVVSPYVIERADWDTIIIR